MKLRLPGYDNNFRLFCVKQIQVQIVQDRGFIVSKKERNIFLSDNSKKLSYENFVEKYHKKKDSENLEEDVLYDKFNGRGEIELDRLNEIYYSEDGKESVEVYFCKGESLNVKLTELAVPDEPVKFIDKKRKLRNLFFFCDGRAEFTVELDRKTNLEIALFQQLYIDPRKHIFSSDFQKVSEAEKDDLFGTDAMKGKTTTLISFDRDPLSICMSLEKGDLIRIFHDDVYAGYQRSFISYRTVS